MCTRLARPCGRTWRARQVRDGSPPAASPLRPHRPTRSGGARPRQPTGGPTDARTSVRSRISRLRRSRGRGHRRRDPSPLPGGDAPLAGRGAGRAAGRDARDRSPHRGIRTQPALRLRERGHLRPTTDTLHAYLDATANAAEAELDTRRIVVAEMVARARAAASEEPQPFLSAARQTARTTRDLLSLLERVGWQGTGVTAS